MEHLCSLFGVLSFRTYFPRGNGNIITRTWDYIVNLIQYCGFCRLASTVSTKIRRQINVVKLNHLK